MPPIVSTFSHRSLPNPARAFRHPTYVMLALCALFSVSCGGEPGVVSPTTASAHAGATSALSRTVMSATGGRIPRDTANARLEELVKEVTALLGSSERRGILEQLSLQSRLPERKLEVAHIVAPGSLLLEGATDEASQRLETLSKSGVELEAYFPVPEHRQAWRGGTNLIVAGQLTEGDQIFAFDLDGRPVSLSEDAPPTTPTLMLVKSETDFRVRPSFAICNPDVSECDGGGGGGGSGPEAAGLYLQYSYLPDLHEPWTRGAPEIEVDLVGPLDDTLDVHLISCASESALSPRRRFNQDDNLWTGSVLVGDSVELEQVRRAYAGAPWSEVGYTVGVFEDDLERCVYHDDYEAWYNNIAAVVSVVGGGAVVFSLEPDEWCEHPLVCGFIYLGLQGLRHLVGGIFDGSDDHLVGAAIAAPAWENATGGQTVSDAVVMLDGAYAGELRFCMRAFNQPTPTCQ